jgi:8-oxo-dGTP diphosphatase
VTVRVALDAEDDARAVADRLRAAGFDARVERDRFAGEDDDEDHAWVVLTDAPPFLVEVVAEEYDGWVDDTVDAPPDPPPAPLDLPDAPRRVKGHWSAE